MTTKMLFTFQHFSTFLFSFLFLVLSSSREATARRDFPSVKKAGNQSAVSSILIFGDSTADPGNNNYIETAFKSNFSPYGKDFVNQRATGRFTNGRLANDFIAKHIGIKEYVPPYLDPTLSIDELKSGVSFASAGSGYDPLTPKISNVISMSEQLEQLKEYKSKLEAAIGKDNTKEVINNALFLVSAGTNDFVVNYFTIPIRRAKYTIPGYMKFVLQEIRQLLKGLLDHGARRIGVVGLPPMGCLPIVISLYADSPILKRDCVSNFSSIARDFNHMLQNELNSMQHQVQASGSRIAYMDIFGPLEDMTLRRKYGFEEVNSGCCGTGLLEASFLCNSKCRVCEDANKYVFWDSIHPSEKSYYIVSQTLQPVIDTLIKK